MSPAVVYALLETAVYEQVAQLANDSNHLPVVPLLHKLLCPARHTRQQGTWSFDAIQFPLLLNQFPLCSTSFARSRPILVLHHRACSHACLEHHKQWKKSLSVSNGKSFDFKGNSFDNTRKIGRLGANDVEQQGEIGPISPCCLTSVARSRPISPLLSSNTLRSKLTDLPLLLNIGRSKLTGSPIVVEPVPLEVE